MSFDYLKKRVNKIIKEERSLVADSKESLQWYSEAYLNALDEAQEARNRVREALVNVANAKKTIKEHEGALAKLEAGFAEMLRMEMSMALIPEAKPAEKRRL